MRCQRWPLLASCCLQPKLLPARPNAHLPALPPSPPAMQLAAAAPCPPHLVDPAGVLYVAVPTAQPQQAQQPAYQPYRAAQLSSAAHSETAPRGQWEEPAQQYGWPREDAQQAQQATEWSLRMAALSSQHPAAANPMRRSRRRAPLVALWSPPPPSGAGTLSPAQPPQPGAACGRGCAHWFQPAQQLSPAAQPGCAVSLRQVHAHMFRS